MTCVPTTFLQVRREQFILNYKVTTTSTSPDTTAFLNSTFSLLQIGATVPLNTREQIATNNFSLFLKSFSPLLFTLQFTRDIIWNLLQLVHSSGRAPSWYERIVVFADEKCVVSHYDQLKNLLMNSGWGEYLTVQRAYCKTYWRAQVVRGQLTPLRSEDCPSCS